MRPTPPIATLGKRRSLLGAVLSALGVFLASAAPVRAFHDGGVAPCSGCHTMHDSQDGAPIAPLGGGPVLLTHDSATEVCLSCHATSYGAVLGSNPLNPPPELGAGNFTFLLEDNLNDGDAPLIIGGNHAGHSIVVPSWGLGTDPEHLAAPGGSYPSSDLGCTSCHDPHGNPEFRMLRGVGPLPGGYHFPYPAPLGDGISVVSGTAESPANHTAYQGGWAAWCANCHGFYHEDVPGFDHPIDHQLGNEWQTYNEYDGPTDPHGGDYLTAYLPEVAFEDAEMIVSSTEGPIGSSRVMCMSCHRAHATSAPSALRWDPNVVRLGDDGVRSLSYPIPNPYGDPEQRALCVKCHYPDAVDHGWSQSCMSCHRDGGEPVGSLGLSGP